MRSGACHAVLSASNEAEGYGIDGTVLAADIGLGCAFGSFTLAHCM